MKLNSQTFVRISTLSTVGMQFKKLQRSWNSKPSNFHYSILYCNCVVFMKHAINSRTKEKMHKVWKVSRKKIVMKCWIQWWWFNSSVGLKLWKSLPTKGNFSNAPPLKPCPFPLNALPFRFTCPFPSLRMLNNLFLYIINNKICFLN